MRGDDGHLVLEPDVRVAEAVIAQSDDALPAAVHERVVALEVSRSKFHHVEARTEQA